MRNSKVIAPSLSKAQLLSMYGGAYTTMRTVDHTSVLELSMHCSRLSRSAEAVLLEELATRRCDAVGAAAREQACAFLRSAGPGGLKALVTAEISAAMQARGAGDAADNAYGSDYQARGADGVTDNVYGGDYQVTLVLTCDGTGPHTPADRGFDIYTVLLPLPHYDEMVDVIARPALRKNPAIKDLKWVSCRKQYEELQERDGGHETLMLDTSGHVTEGLQTNFFAVTHNQSSRTLWTAPDADVLPGTLRKLVLQVAPQQGINVTVDAPAVDAASTWDSCFICSSSRLVIPIRELRVFKEEDGNPTVVRFAPKGTVAHQLAEVVRETLRAHSELLE